MEMEPYVSHLRYLDASNVEAGGVDLDGLGISGSDNRKIGDVDGFIIDPAGGRAHYIVIDSGGWFTSRRLLLPIGHAALATDRRSLLADVSRDALQRLPEFDESAFGTFSDDELRAFERNTVLACCPDEPLEDVSVATWGYESRRHYTEPEWWRDSRYVQERLRPLGAPAVDSGQRVLSP
jgi:PRC-barrel domain